MGCGNSKKKEKFQRAVYPLRPLITRLNIPEADVKRVYNEFARLDEDGSGAVSLYELLDRANLEHTKFAERAFMAMDRTSNRGEREALLDFSEFFVGMWNYCSLDKEALVRFTFDLMDKDQGGTLSVSEVRELVSMIHGSRQPDAATNKVMKTLDHDRDGTVTFAEFKQMERRAQSLLFPVFNLQRELSSAICGQKFWKRAAKIRKESAAGQDLIALHAELVQRQRGG